MNQNKNKTLYVSPTTARTLARYLIDNSLLDSTSIEDILGCGIEELDSLDFRLSVDTYSNLWNQALSISEDPALGLHLGSNPGVDEMGLVGHIFFNNATLGNALKQYERFYTLVNEGIHVELIEDNDFISITYVCDYPEAYCIPDIERTLAISIYRAKQHISPKLDIEYIGLQHKEPSYIQEYTNTFPCPLKFNQENTCLVFKKSYLDFKLPKRSSYLHSILNKHIETLLTKIRPEPPLSAKVKKLLKRKLSKDHIDATHIADKLCMSRHTLYRKLKNEGISYHELVDQVREEKAFRYLDERKYSLSEIAFLLGFSELSAFSRAFKRWTGKSPAKYLKEMD